MEVTALAIPEVKLLRPAKHSDERGFFSETYSRRRMREAGIDLTFVQENQSLSRQVGTVRGLHFQTPPAAQDKLVRVARGRIFDVAVDIRAASPTYGQWVGAELSAHNWLQILVPAGFAHGFCTLESDTEVIYMVTHDYAPANDAALRWNDPDIGIDWPIRPDSAALSGKDAGAPSFRDFVSPFSYP